MDPTGGRPVLAFGEQTSALCLTCPYHVSAMLA